MLDRNSAALDLGAVRVQPHERLIVSATDRTTVEPLVMQLLMLLAGRAGQLVTRREIFARCWGSAPAGDDSLNRLVAVLRKALNQVAGGRVTVETVPGTGYVLRLAPDHGKSVASGAEEDVQQAITAAFDSWRAGLPEPDHPRLELLRAACRAHPESAAAWASLALLCRQAAEYAEPDRGGSFLAECEAAARNALALEAGHPRASAALASVAPLFGRWQEARLQLAAILENGRDDPVPRHDLAIVEMATGRIRAAKSLMDRLIAADPLAACFAYKSIYQHWSVGDLAGMDQVADRAVQLWPTHPAVWTARMWTLAYTGRAEAALGMLQEPEIRPAIPPPMLAFVRQVLVARLERDGALAQQAVAASRRVAATGPAQAIASLFALGLLGPTEALLEVAEAYYVRSGSNPVPIRQPSASLSITDQHRRLTQILFTPVFAPARAEQRFTALCERIGLARYWDESGLAPDLAG